MLVKFMNGYTLMLAETEKSKAHKKAVACQKAYAPNSVEYYGLYNEYNDLFLMGLFLIDKAHTAGGAIGQGRSNRVPSH